MKKGGYMFFIVRVENTWKKVWANTQEEALKLVNGQEVLAEIPTSEFLRKERAYEDYFNGLLRKRMERIGEQLNQSVAQ